METKQSGLTGFIIAFFGLGTFVLFMFWFVVPFSDASTVSHERVEIRQDPNENSFSGRFEKARIEYNTAKPYDFPVKEKTIKMLSSLQYNESNDSGCPDGDGHKDYVFKTNDNGDYVIRGKNQKEWTTCENVPEGDGHYSQIICVIHTIKKSYHLKETVIFDHNKLTFASFVGEFGHGDNARYCTYDLHEKEANPDMK